MGVSEDRRVVVDDRAQETSNSIVCWDRKLSEGARICASAYYVPLFPKLHCREECRLDLPPRQFTPECRFGKIRNCSLRVRVAQVSCKSFRRCAEGHVEGRGFKRGREWCVNREYCRVSTGCCAF